MIVTALTRPINTHGIIEDIDAAVNGRRPPLDHVMIIACKSTIRFFALLTAIDEATLAPFTVPFIFFALHNLNTVLSGQK